MPNGSWYERTAMRSGDAVVPPCAGAAAPAALVHAEVSGGPAKPGRPPALPAYRQVVLAIARMPAPSLPAETVEFSVSHSTEKCVPFIRSEPENRAAAVPAVAYADLTGGKARHLDAVAVGEAQGALNPVRTRPFWRGSECRSFHVTTSLMSISARMCSYRM